MGAGLAHQPEPVPDLQLENGVLEHIGQAAAPEGGVQADIPGADFQLLVQAQPTAHRAQVYVLGRQLELGAHLYFLLGRVINEAALERAVYDLALDAQGPGLAAGDQVGGRRPLYGQGIGTPLHGALEGQNQGFILGGPADQFIQIEAEYAAGRAVAQAELHPAQGELPELHQLHGRGLGGGGGRLAFCFLRGVKSSNCSPRPF